MAKENYYYNGGQVYCKTTMQKCPIDDTVTGSSCPYCGNNPDNLFINGSDGITLVTSDSNCNIPHVSVAVAVEEILKPKYMNDIYTWKQVRDAINKATER